MDIGKLVEKYDNGDSLTDLELIALIQNFEQLYNVLSILHYKPYRLMFTDSYQKLSMMKTYAKNRELIK